MRIKDVNLPEPLIAAQRNGTLVVFAGAGISVDPPSNLPDFARLADQIARGTLTIEENEPIDRFLGRLERQGVKVHARAQSLLGDPASEPNDLHRIIISLYHSADSVRIVTTNFDRHLSSAAEMLLGSIQTYHAPALPLGKKFNGLVYLHGSLDREPERLVLTDADFGRAYLTEGWATRFLTEMFLAFTVLFIGYSHDDPVIRYLARALLPGTARFALVPPGDNAKWEFLGITPIIYPLRDAPQPHRVLGETLSAWADLVRMGALDHEARLKATVASPPPIDPEVADYVEFCLSDVVTLRMFTRHARGIDWLHWVQNKKPFRALFTVNETVDDLGRQMASWFDEHFVIDHSDEALALIEQHKQSLNPFLWQSIAGTLAHTRPRPDSMILGKWVPVLLSSYHVDWGVDELCFLLSECRFPEDTVIIVLLFDYLTQPRVSLEASFHLSEAGVELGGPRAEIVMTGDSYWLRKTWNTTIKPNLSELAGSLESIITNQLTKAHLLLRAFGSANEQWDPLSFSRSAIEPHEQNHYFRSTDWLVDGARDIIEWMLNSDPASAHAVIKAWGDSRVPLLSRLAIHGVCEDGTMNPDEKLKWILGEDLFFALDARHEVFRLLEKTYSSASEAIRKQVLDQAERGPSGLDAPQLDERMRARLIFNLIDWLSRVSPKDLLTTERFERFRKEHPGFERSEHPDMTHWMTSGWGGGGRFKTEELLARNPGEIIELLEMHSRDGSGELDRADLLNSVANAATQRFIWGLDLATALKERGEWDSELWKSILQGWRAGKLTEDQWTEVLELLDDCSPLWETKDYVIDLLLDGVAASHGAMPSSAVTLAERLADRMWESLANRTDLPEESSSDNWLATARAHPGGRVVMLWLHGLSRRRAEQKRGWLGLLEEYLQRFEGILSDHRYPARLGRVVLASELCFLFSLDPEWTRKRILPLLDWAVSEAQAEQAWHGYLSRDGCNEVLFADLMPLLKQTFKVQGRLKHFRGEFCNFLARAAVYSSINPVKDGWLQDFLRDGDEETRVSWAGSIGQVLPLLEKPAVEDLWQRWMDEYWQLRNTGVPASLSSRESSQMLSWVIPLEPVFPHVVDRILAISASGSSVEAFGLLHRLQNLDIAKLYPESLSQLLQHLLKNAIEPFFHCDLIEGLVRKLVSSAAKKTGLVQICNDMARLGCPGAADLKDVLEKSA